MAQTTANLVGSSYISKSVAMPSESSPADEENPEIQVPTGPRSPTKARGLSISKFADLTNFWVQIFTWFELVNAKNLVMHLWLIDNI